MPHRDDMHTQTLDIERALAAMGRRFHARGWAFGTSGNYSAVVSRQPLRLAITASARNKRVLRAADILTVDEEGRIAGSHAGDPGAAPSAETALHLALARRRQAGAVLHTHSIWSTVLSETHAAAGGVWIEGYEMLKGLHGVQSHEHREWVPVLDNDQDMTRLTQRLEAVLDDHAHVHAFLLRRHGMYTWGDTLADAERHVEILEFLFEAMGRG